MPVKANSHRHARHDTDRTVLSCLVWWAGGVNWALSWLNLRNRASNTGSAHCKTHRTANTNAIDANVIFLLFSRWWPSAILMDLPKLEFLTTDADAIYTTWETDKKHGCQPTDGDCRRNASSRQPVNDGPNSLVACKLGDLIDYRLLLVQMMLLLHYGRMASECTTAEFRSRLKRGQLGHGASLQKI